MTTTDDTRARFHRLTAEAFAEPLAGGCVVRIVDEDEWKQIHARLEAEAFAPSGIDNRALHDDATRARFESLDAFRSDAVGKTDRLRVAGVLTDGE